MLKQKILMKKIPITMNIKYYFIGEKRAKALKLHKI